VKTWRKKQRKEKKRKKREKRGSSENFREEWTEERIKLNSCSECPHGTACCWETTLTFCTGTLQQEERSTMQDRMGGLTCFTLISILFVCMCFVDF